MVIDLTKEDLINMLNGVTPNMEKSIELENKGFMVFSGNQNNPKWSWTDKVNELAEQSIFELYLEIK